MLAEQGFLNGRQYLIGIAVKARLVLGREAAGNRLIVTVEQVAGADPAAVQVSLELRGNLRRGAAREVIDALVVVIQADFGKLFADAFGLRDQPLGSAAELTGLSFAVTDIAAQLADRHGQFSQAFVVLPGAAVDLADLALYIRCQAGNALQLRAGVLDLLRGQGQLFGLLLHMADHRRALLADIADDLPDFLGGAAGAAGQVTHFIGDHRKAAPQFTGAGCFDGRIKRQQVGLAGNRLDHLGDFFDLLGATAQAVNQLTAGGGLRTQVLHGIDRLPQFLLPAAAVLPHALRGNQGLFGALGTVLFGVGDGLGGLVDLLGGAQLRLQFAGQLLRRMRHLSGGQGVVAGVPRQVLAQGAERIVWRLDGGGQLFMLALPGPQPGPQGQQQKGRNADKPGQLDLLVRHHQPGQPDGMQQAGLGVGNKRRTHDKPRYFYSGRATTRNCLRRATMKGAGHAC